MSSIRVGYELMEAACDKLPDRKREAYKIFKEWDKNFVDSDVTKERFYDEIEIFYTSDPTRMLKMFFPVKMMNLKRYRRIHAEDFDEYCKEGNRERIEWRELVKCALGKASDMGLLNDWEVLNRALIVLTVFEAGNRRHDVDNFAIGAINNALKENRIISDDDIECMRYFVQGVYLPRGKRSAEGTCVAVLDIEDSDIKFHSWKPEDLR